MKRNRFGRGLALFLIIYAMLIMTSVSAIASGENEKDTVTGYQNLGVITDVSASDEAIEAGSFKVGSRIWELLFGEQSKTVSLIPGGEVFGVKIKQKNVTVTDAKGIPALKNGDVIISINGKEVKTAEEVQKLVSSCNGESVTIRALHNGEEIALEVRPKIEDGKYKLGISLRDGAVGIGTVTFVDPKTGLFGGLGHGICDGESGEIVELESGDICGVILGGIHKGECGKPGELCGILTDEDYGDLSVNCECGVFGVVTGEHYMGDAIPVGTKDAIREGEATIISTLKNGKTAKYKIEIYDIDKNSTGSKSFKIRVTDETLKALTGGIVRGMSGSPIIQDSKLVGAVTHVLVANPTEGYGIFIENMLNAAQNQVQPKAA